jgi:hypothetical protein
MIQLKQHKVLVEVALLAIIILITYHWMSSDNILIGLNESLAKINGPMDNFKVFLYSLLVIIASISLISLLILLICWLLRDEGIFIQPFIVGCCDDNYNGNAMSDLLTAELIKIRNIHISATPQKSEVTWRLKAKNFIDNFIVSAGRCMLPSIPSYYEINQEKNKQFDGSEKKRIALPNVYHSSENLAYNVSSVNISGGPITISAGQMLLLFRKISGHPVDTITGSIQKYGSTINLVAWMGGHKIGAWDVKRDLVSRTLIQVDDYDISEESETGDIQDMVRELAFRIAREISVEDITAKTWIGLKFYTGALDEYNLYKAKHEIKRLKRSWELCIFAIKVERRL